MTINAPVPFDGTPEEREENRNSHSFQPDSYGENPRCFRCDVKPWYVSADYPCGAVVPRAEMTDEEYLKGVQR